jgi:hypothetical protein
MADEFTFGITDPGQGLVQEATSTPFVYGPCSGGSANVLETFNSIPDLLTAHPQGPAVESAAYILTHGGGPIRFMKSGNTVAASVSAVVESGAPGPDVTATGTPNDFYDVKAEIVLGGALGVATFRYTLDGGKTYSSTLTTPVGLTYLIPNTGVTLTFTVGTQVAGTIQSFTTTPAMWNSADLAAGIAVITADFTPWDFFVGCGRHATATAAATVGAALQSSLEGLVNSQRWVRGMLDAGDEAHAALITAYAATVSPRLLYAYRGLRRSTPKAFPGWGTPKLAAVDGMAMLAARSLISTHLGRYLSHNLATFGATEIDYDEEKTAALNGHKIATLRTIPGSPGIWVKTPWLKGADGSDFQRWQFGRVMDQACKTTYLSLLPFLNVGLRSQTRIINSTTYLGTLDDREITRIEDKVNEALSAVLRQPANAEGTAGHVTDIRYTIDRTWNALSNQSIKGEVAIVRLAYAEKFKTQLGFAAQILSQAA